MTPPRLPPGHYIGDGHNHGGDIDHDHDHGHVDGHDHDSPHDHPHAGEEHPGTRGQAPTDEFQGAQRETAAPQGSARQEAPQNPEQQQTTSRQAGNPQPELRDSEFVRPNFANQSQPNFTQAREGQGMARMFSPNTMTSSFLSKALATPSNSQASSLANSQSSLMRMPSGMNPARSESLSHAGFLITQFLEGKGGATVPTKVFVAALGTIAAEALRNPDSLKNLPTQVRELVKTLLTGDAKGLQSLMAQLGYSGLESGLEALFGTKGLVGLSLAGKFFPEGLKEFSLAQRSGLLLFSSAAPDPRGTLSRAQGNPGLLTSLEQALGQFSKLLFGNFALKPVKDSNNPEDPLLQQLAIFLSLREKRRKRKTEDGKKLKGRHQIESKQNSDFTDRNQGETSEAILASEKKRASDV